MGFSKEEYEHKAHATPEYHEGAKKHLDGQGKSLQEMMVSDDTAEDISLAADVGCENLILSNSISDSADATNADV